MVSCIYFSYAIIEYLSICLTIINSFSPPLSLSSSKLNQLMYMCVSVCMCAYICMHVFLMSDRPNIISKYQFECRTQNRYSLKVC